MKQGAQRNALLEAEGVILVFMVLICRSDVRLYFSDVTLMAGMG